MNDIISVKLKRRFDMCAKPLNTMFIWFALCVLLISISTTSTPARVDYSTGRRREPPERMELIALGLNEDANDNEIVKLLDDPDREKLVHVVLAIRYRKISWATPKLLRVFNDSKTHVVEKIWIADALCDFGNREWMPTIKALAVDPNSPLDIPLKIDVAGLLARAGDYSQFEVVADGVSDSKDYIRSTAIHELGNFGHKTDPVTDSAAELLTSAAKSEPVPFLRERAIESLEKIAKAKPEVTAKVIEALQANKDSSDKDLRIMCRAKLKMYGKELKAD